MFPMSSGGATTASPRSHVSGNDSSGMSRRSFAERRAFATVSAPIVPWRSSEKIEGDVSDVPNGKRAAREAAERALQDAALRLLRRDGVLAGLNMQEVADEASVNRGLIHRWFGSRQALLRAAIRSRQTGLAAGVRASLQRSPSRRTAWAVQQYVDDPSYAQMVMLLSLDGDESFEPVPYFAERLDAFRAEIEAGVWHADVDPLALTVLWDVILDGYFTMREALVRQTGVPARELDRRLFVTVGRLFGAVLTGSDGRVADEPDAGSGTPSTER